MVHRVIDSSGTFMQTGKGVFGLCHFGLKGELHDIISYPISRIIKGISDGRELGKEGKVMDNARKLAAYFFAFFFFRSACPAI